MDSSPPPPKKNKTKNWSNQLPQPQFNNFSLPPHKKSIQDQIDPPSPLIENSPNPSQNGWNASPRQQKKSIPTPFGVNDTFPWWKQVDISYIPARQQRSRAESSQ